MLQWVKKFLSSVVDALLVWNLWGWLARVWLSALMRWMSSDDTVTCPCTILYNSTSPNSHLQFSSFFQPCQANMDVMLLVVLWSPHTNLAVCHMLALAELNKQCIQMFQECRFEGCWCRDSPGCKAGWAKLGPMPGWQCLRWTNASPTYIAVWLDVSSGKPNFLCERWLAFQWYWKTQRQLERLWHPWSGAIKITVRLWDIWVLLSTVGSILNGGKVYTVPILDHKQKLQTGRFLVFPIHKMPNKEAACWGPTLSQSLSHLQQRVSLDVARTWKMHCYWCDALQVPLLQETDPQETTMALSHIRHTTQDKRWDRNHRFG